MFYLCSKILERLVYDHLFSFLNSNDILTDNQHGSCETLYLYGLNNTVNSATVFSISLLIGEFLCRWSSDANS